ncbi:MAG: MATE family efflux transporter [Candidatus Sumerlaeia bacterium]|nr:MATE family efflux transporter [Candidatus Sumerlaeia bacterium]
MILPHRVPGLLRRAVRIGLPISVANFVVAASQMVELLIVGRHLGTDAFGGVSLAATFTLVLVLAFYSLQIAVQAVVSRRHGARDHGAAGAALNTALAIGAGCGAAVFLVFQLLGPEVFVAERAEISTLAFQYFRWRLPSIPMLVLILSIVGFFNGIGRPDVTLRVYAPVLVAHLAMVWAFTGGLGAEHSLGVRGAGLASTLSTAMGLGLFLWHLARPALRERYGLLRFRTGVTAQAARSIVAIGLPIFFQQILGNFSIYLFQVIAAQVPDHAATLVATNIALLFINISTLPGLGFGTAAATMAGQALGAGQPARADAAVRLCWLLGACWMFALGAFYALGGEWIASQFLARAGDPRVTAEQHATVLALSSTFFLIAGLQQFFDSFNTILGKALQGLGLTRFVLTRNMVSQWGFFLPVAYILALPMGMGGTGAWLGMMGYLALNAAMFLHRFLSGKWKTHKV